MPTTLELAGRATSRLGDAASAVPVVVRDVTSLVSPTVAWSGVTDINGYYTSALLDDAKEYRTEVTYDPANNYKVLRDIASGQMNMLQVRKRFHVRGASTPCIIDGNVAVGGAIDATDLKIAGQSLDARFYNVGETVALATNATNAATAATANNALALGGVAPAGYSPAAHTHAYAPTAHDHFNVYGRTDIVEWDGDNSGARAVYTPPAGWSCYGAIIHEVIGAGTFAIVTRNVGFGYQGCTNAFANTGPGADEIQPGSVFFDSLNNGALTVGGVNPGVGMNFLTSKYLALVFLKDTSPG